MKKILSKKNLLVASTVIASLLLSSCGSTSGTPEKEADKMPGSIIAGSKPSGTQIQTNIPQPTPTPVPEKKTVKAKGLYLTASSAGGRLKHYIELANTTEINSYVIDYKNDEGIVSVNSSVPAAKEVKAIQPIYDAEKVTKELRDNNIYSIARIVCFKDPFFSKGKPQAAIKNKSGDLFIHNGVTWVNPYSKEAWQYNIDLAKEALAKGFDEVQFDYVRFPDGKKSNMVFGDTSNKMMYETINEFLAEARKQMPNAVLSADVFAIICETPGDNEGIGQYLELIGKDIDYICPMAYPSHYALGQIINGTAFKKPDFEPYGVIKNTLVKAKTRFAKVDGPTPKVRTYLQDFDASWIGKGNWQRYGDEQIRQQIQGVYDAGYEEWFLWDPMNTYHEGALKKE
ncbi:MAG TPA: putative glycoside hydrolase [Pseudobacteroides sp.]|uniref:putative glycoside hydrolase n=1 Tax=Pseudobacteroides sp. TaxID=1968840 RepID=UPI002F9538E3